MKIILVTYIYKPDKGPSAQMFSLLCETLVKMGHEVHVVATVPHFPSGIVTSNYQNKWVQKSIGNGVNIKRIRIPSLRRGRLVNRVIQFLFFQILASVACLVGDFDVAVVTNPAMNKGLPFFVLATIRNIPSIFLVADVYPDVGIKTGVFRNRIVIKLVEALEKYCLNHADVVWVLSESFIPRMKSMGVPEHCLHVLGPWVDTDFIKPLSKENDFSKENDLSAKFVVMYAGNLGLSQGLENVLSAAEKIQKNSEIQFVFVGEGIARETLVREARNQKLANVKFLKFQPWENVPEVMASADLFIISLKPGIGEHSLPSKSFTYLASGRPILAVVEEGCSIWKLISDSQSGVCVPYGDTDQIINVILNLYKDQNQRERMGRKSRQCALRNFSVHNAAENIETMCQKAIQSHKS